MSYRNESNGRTIFEGLRFDSLPSGHSLKENKPLKQIDNVETCLFSKICMLRPNQISHVMKQGKDFQEGVFLYQNHFKNVII